MSLRGTQSELLPALDLDFVIALDFAWDMQVPMATTVPDPLLSLLKYDMLHVISLARRYQTAKTDTGGPSISYSYLYTRHPNNRNAITTFFHFYEVTDKQPCRQLVSLANTAGRYFDRNYQGSAHPITGGIVSLTVRKKQTKPTPASELLIQPKSAKYCSHDSIPDQSSNRSSIVQRKDGT